MQDKNVIKLTEQDAVLLEQAASMLEGLDNDERNRGNCSTAKGAGCSAHAVRRLASALLAHEREIGQCLHQIAEPTHPTACTVEEVRAFEAAAAPAAVAVPDERAAFEKWASFVGYSIKRWRDDANLYEDNATEDAWIAWQARAALAAAPAGPTANELATQQHATQEPVATAFFTEKGEVCITGIFDRTLKELNRVKKTRNGISSGSIDLYTAAAAPACVAEPAPITLMTEDQAREFAWGKVREDVGTTGWTTGDSSNFYGFFMWGWKYGAQYELQRTAAPAAPVVLPEPDVAVKEVMELAKDWSQRSLIAAEYGIDALSEESSEKQRQEAKRLDDEAETAYRAIEAKLRALLAGVSAPAVPVQSTTEPVVWAISYDGKTPYALWPEGDGALLDTEIKRLGGTARKMPLYAAPAADALDAVTVPVSALRDLRKDHIYMGLCPEDSQPDSRDEDCPCCKAMGIIDAAIAAQAAKGA